MSAPHLTVSSTRLADLLHPWNTTTPISGRAGPAYRTLADRIRALLLDGRTPGLPDLDPDLPLPRCLRTSVRGTTVYELDGALG